MNRKHLAIGVALVTAIVLAGLYQLRPPRLTDAHREEALNVLERLERTEQAEQAIRAEGGDASGAASQQAALAAIEPTEEEALPEPFQVKFETSVGDFVVECYPEWAPLGAERFRELVDMAFFDEARFFRVVPGFVVQFGIPADPELAAEWRENTFRDEPVRQNNTAGTITFAKSAMPHSRTTQLFVNLGDNHPLDQMGFAPFARVVEGMEVVRAINDEYGEQPNQHAIQMQGNAYLEAEFPELDYIKRARVIGEEDEDESGGGDDGQ